MCPMTRHGRLHGRLRQAAAGSEAAVAQYRELEAAVKPFGMSQGWGGDGECRRCHSIASECEVDIAVPR